MNWIACYRERERERETVRERMRMLCKFYRTQRKHVHSYSFLFTEQLYAPITSNGSKWGNFHTDCNKAWSWSVWLFQTLPFSQERFPPKDYHRKLEKRKKKKSVESTFPPTESALRIVPIHYLMLVMVASSQFGLDRHRVGPVSYRVGPDLTLQ